MDAIITGFMGSGKTTVTQLVADKMELKFHDLDNMIVEHLGKTISEFFDEQGENEFRKVETNVLQNAIQVSGILATGGGTPIHNVDVFKNTNLPVFLLDASDETIQERLSKDKGRPLVDQLGMNGVIDMKHNRNSVYQDIADYTIFTDNKDPEMVANEIIKILRR